MNKLITILRESRLARFLLPVGLILIVVGVFMFVITQNSKDFVQAEATVTKVVLEQEAHTDADGTRVEATYTVSVKYTANGKEYTTDLGGMPSYKEGEKLTIYYNPSDPAQITQSKSLLVPLIMIIAGIAAFAGGIVSGINAIKRIQKMKKQEEEWGNA